MPIRRTLRGHKKEVIEGCWSPDDTMVASCSFDNSVIVYDAQTGQKLQTLKGHTGMVKGIGWDPVGKYLATKSDDQSVIVWRAGDWAIEAKLTEPFQTLFESLFSKVSWAPDGSFLASSHASNQGQPVGVIFPRGKWKDFTNIVGHHQLITAVVRFLLTFRFLLPLLLCPWERGQSSDRLMIDD